jgi:predicted alpha/beta hydrolase family esterase
MSDATVVLVPGLRGHVEDHWQTRLAASLPGARTVPPLGRTDAGLQARVTLLDQIVEDVAGPVVLVAHSAGVLVTVDWAAQYSPTRVVGALLVTPAAFAVPLPPEYPSIEQLRAHGWLPVPRRPLPSRASSRSARMTRSATRCGCGRWAARWASATFNSASGPGPASTRSARWSLPPAPEVPPSWPSPSSSS